MQNYRALTRREKQIFELAINGLQNKQIASELGITEITVKVHRRRVMDKMQVRTLADLVHAAARCKSVNPDVHPAGFIDNAAIVTGQFISP